MAEALEIPGVQALSGNYAGGVGGMKLSGEVFSWSMATLLALLVLLAVLLIAAPEHLLNLIVKGQW